jgi:hypothetical protein
MTALFSELIGRNHIEAGRVLEAARGRVREDHIGLKLVRKK